jgi:hypothetical protein
MLSHHSIDSSCRPTEILGLRIHDIHFKISGTNQINNKIHKAELISHIFYNQFLYKSMLRRKE